jgi:phosphatidylinositol dimannoside acyltransferase
MTGARAEAPDVRGGRGTRVQRLRARAVAAASAVACHAPEGPLFATADAMGELWYRTSPERAGMARRNLARVAAWLDAEGRGPARARRAATDPAALESLVRSAYRQNARYYLELLREPAMSGAYVQDRVRRVDADVLDAALGEPGGVVFAAAHFGPIELPSKLVTEGRGGEVVAVMEAVADPELQAWIARSRAGHRLGLVGLGEARTGLRRVLEDGGAALIVVDRDLTGGGTEVPLFGHPAPLPTGAALLAIDTGAPVYFSSVRRVGNGRYVGRMRRIPVPAEGRLRERAIAVLDATARAIEDAVATAPDQWSAVFFPIWPDLEAAARPGAAGPGASGGGSR